MALYFAHFIGAWREGYRAMLECGIYVERISWTETDSSQSVRRKGGKTGKGHVYIICSLNPKHKQRQGK